MHRKLYALRVLEFIDTAEVVDSKPHRSRPSQVMQPTPLPVPPAAQGLPFADDDAATQNLLAGEFLSFRGKDAFELLGVSIDTQGQALQKAFLEKSTALSPLRFKSADARSKAEALLAAYARAYGQLAEADTWQLHRDRRAAREARKPEAQRKNAAAEAFRIRTDLLDAGAQFDEGRKRLREGNHRGAVEHLQYAVDIEPQPRFLAWLAWAKYQADPQHEARATLATLAEVTTQDPNCEEAWAWRGELAMAFSQHAEAEDAWRKAYRLAPDNKRYVELIKSAASMQKKK